MPNKLSGTKPKTMKIALIISTWAALNFKAIKAAPIANEL